MQTNQVQQRIHFTLRIAVAMCFIGHGAFGIITKRIWCNYFAVFGIRQSMAYTLMPVLGTADILLGLTMLFFPVRAIPGWLVVWGLVTAMLRPLSGEPVAEFIERAGNFGAPLAFLLMYARVSQVRKIFTPVPSATLVDDISMKRVAVCLQLVVFFLLAGHGWLNLLEKKGLIAQYTAIGFGNPANVARIVGVAELVAALSVLVRPLRPLLVLFFLWKMSSELFYPHWELFEWIERGGSYGCLLALYLISSPKTLSSDAISDATSFAGLNPSN